MRHEYNLLSTILSIYLFIIYFVLLLLLWLLLLWLLSLLPPPLSFSLSIAFFFLVVVTGSQLGQVAAFQIELESRISSADVIVFRSLNPALGLSLSTERFSIQRR